MVEGSTKKLTFMTLCDLFQDIREYFEKYGEVMMVQLKIKESGQSKGKNSLKSFF